MFASSSDKEFAAMLQRRRYFIGIYVGPVEDLMKTDKLEGRDRPPTPATPHNGLKPAY
jgi:hypothetical protein